MRTGRYVLKDLFLNNEVDQFIIPELQRDYVWSQVEVNKFWNSIQKKYKEKKEQFSQISILEDGVEMNDKVIIEHLKRQLNIVKHKQKFGFIYAYHDKEFPGKFYLIDGQQRLTTFYVLLIALYDKLDLQEEFIRNYFVNKSSKLDYKVRESAHVFLKLFLNNILSKKDFREDPNFFEQEYIFDVTVKNIIKNYDFFKLKINQESDIEWLDFLDYIENYIEFNYFDTNLSEQGERLYLYMNSRGFKLSSQEILRAKIIEKCSIENKIIAGEKWEEWQDFFFKNRNGNPDSDFGFEAFLLHISYLKKQTEGNLKKDLFDEFKDLKNYQIDHLDIDFIELSQKTLQRLLFENQREELYYKGYFDNKSLSKKLLFRYLSVWYYLIKFKNEVSDSELELIRLFSLNQSHTRDVGNDPIEELLRFFAFVDSMNTSNILDINNIDLVSQCFDKSSEEHLQHEKHKLLWLKNESHKSELLSFLKEIYFDEVLNDLIEGKTGCFFYWSESIKEILFDFSFMYRCIRILKELAFKKKELNEYSSNFTSKTLRRFILSNFDFSEQKGKINNLDKVNLVNDERALFSRIFLNTHFLYIIKDLENESINLKELDFDQIASKLDPYDWKYYFVKYPNVLLHSKNNLFAKDDCLSKYIVIRNSHQSVQNHYLICLITQYLLQQKIVTETNSKIVFNLYDLGIIYFDFIIENGRVICTEEHSNRYAIDFIYNKETKQWFYKLFMRESGEELVKESTIFFLYQSEYSLEKNSKILRDKILSIVEDLPQIVDLVIDKKYK